MNVCIKYVLLKPNLIVTGLLILLNPDNANLKFHVKIKEC